MNNKNHELYFVKYINSIYGSRKIYKCLKCNYELCSYKEDNFVELFINMTIPITSSLSCEEMQIKRLLE